VHSDAYFVMLVFENCFFSALAPYVYSRDGRSLSIYGHDLNAKYEKRFVTLILYRHYLKIVGNNKLWPDMQKESWNIHLKKI
jgi:hypothetical protein